MWSCGEDLALSLLILFLMFLMFQKRFEKWFLGFWHQTSKASRLEAQLSVLKNDIASEKRALASLDREAREHAGGESPSSSGCDDLT